MGWWVGRWEGCVERGLACRVGGRGCGSETRALSASPCRRRYFAQMVEALEYVHRAGFVHRSVALRHFLVDHRDVVKLSDFSAADSVLNARQCSEWGGRVGRVGGMGGWAGRGEARRGGAGRGRIWGRVRRALQCGVWWVGWAVQKVGQGGDRVLTVRKTWLRPTSG